MIIENGKGGGTTAGVTSSNRLLTSAVSISSEHATNQEDGLSFNAMFSQKPTADDDCIFYMKNTSEIDLVIEGLTLSADAACQVYCKLDDIGTRSGAVEITPANLNAGSGKSAEGEFEQGVDLGGGASSLDGGYEIERYVYIAASGSSFKNFNQDVILPKNRTFTIYCNSLSAEVTGTVVFNYHNSELV